MMWVSIVFGYSHKTILTASSTLMVTLNLKMNQNASSSLKVSLKLTTFTRTFIEPTRRITTTNLTHSEQIKFVNDWFEWIRTTRLWCSTLWTSGLLQKKLIWRHSCSSRSTVSTTYSLGVTLTPSMQSKKHLPGLTGWSSRKLSAKRALAWLKWEIRGSCS